MDAQINIARFSKSAIQPCLGRLPTSPAGRTVYGLSGKYPSSLTIAMMRLSQNMPPH